MAGNSQRRGAMRKEGTKKGADRRLRAARSARRSRAASPRPRPSTVRTIRRRDASARRRSGPSRHGQAVDARAAAAGARRGSVLVGRNPVVEALRAKIPAIDPVRADQGRRRRPLARGDAAGGRRMNIPILEVAKSELDRMSEGAVHQGLVLTVPEYDYADAGRPPTRTLHRGARRRHRPAQPRRDRALGGGLRRRRHRRARRAARSGSPHRPGRRRPARSRACPSRRSPT